MVIRISKRKRYSLNLRMDMFCLLLKRKIKNMRRRNKKLMQMS